jgi:hypothetical protein
VKIPARFPAKRACKIVLLVATLVVLAFALTRPKSQIITTPGGEPWEFAGVTWGTNRVPPALLPRSVSNLPRSAATFVQRKLGGHFGLMPYSGIFTRYDEPTQYQLFSVWFRYVGTNTPASLPSMRGIMTGEGSSSTLTGYSSGTIAGKTGWLSVNFLVAPRRSRTLSMRCFDAGTSNEVGQIEFRNPYFGSFPQWQPESIPVSKQVEDVEVSLTEFKLGNHGVAQCKFDVHPRKESNSHWLFQSAELCDATGNKWCVRPPYERSVTNMVTFQPLLADEKAWRIKVDLKRHWWLDKESHVTLKAIPVPPVHGSNVVFMTNLVQGVPVLLKQEFFRQPNSTNVVAFPVFGFNTSIRLSLPTAPEGYAVDFVSITDDVGWRPVSHSFQTPDVFINPIPTNVTKVNVTWSVQKLRSAEFFVAPAAK